VIEFKPFAMKPDETDVTVQTEVKQPGGKPIPIDYAMYKTAFGWKVYDVTIDGVSLVINYRSSFANTIRQSGIDGLISTLEAKSKGVSKEPKPSPAGEQPRQPAKPVSKVKATKAKSATATPNPVGT
jgi:phospholipid transport system substrate-binding protein